MENLQEVPQKEYNVDYFINKFTLIPEWLWCTKDYSSINNTHCAFGHCGVDNYVGSRGNNESRALANLFMDKGLQVAHVNDGDDSDLDERMYTINFKQPTPKQRILAALNYIKEQQNK